MNVLSYRTRPRSDYIHSPATNQQRLHRASTEHRIISMRRKFTAALILLVLLLPVLLAAPLLAIDGTFEGRVVDPPSNQPVLAGWIYIQGRNRMLRRVEVSHAAIVFGENFPAGQRRKCRMECLGPGQEVRVTAEQDNNGEWRAKRVEILKLAAKAEMPRVQVIKNTY